MLFLAYSETSFCSLFVSIERGLPGGLPTSSLLPSFPMTYNLLFSHFCNFRSSSPTSGNISSQKKKFFPARITLFFLSKNFGLFFFVFVFFFFFFKEKKNEPNLSVVKNVQLFENTHYERRSPFVYFLVFCCCFFFLKKK